ncbi:hypothetical protein ACHQM5_023359 [Ranunculus cassubicifolius]
MTKAMKIAVCVPGVESAAIQGDDKNLLVVIGEGIDSTCLTVRIRKKVGCTELVSVGPFPEKKPDDEKPKPPEKPKSPEKTSCDPCWKLCDPCVPPFQYGYGAPQICFADVRGDPSCSIM